MSSRHQITVNGQTFMAQTGELLLDAALNSGVDLPHDCRAGHCGTCCVRLVSGDVEGGRGAVPGTVHACQCRVSGDAVVEGGLVLGTRSVEGAVTSMRPLVPEVMQVGITTGRALPYLPGQYVKVGFAGYPSRPFSITHPLHDEPPGKTIYLHIRRMQGGRVTTALGRRILPGHPVTLTGAFGSAHFRPGHTGRIILVSSNTGFAPIWAIAVAALRENPLRSLTVIAGGRSLHALYMAPALEQLARFPGTTVIPVCSGQQPLPPIVRPGRPTDFLPALTPADVIYACGAKAMVDAVRSMAARSGAICHADPFVTGEAEATDAPGLLKRAAGLLAVPSLRRSVAQPRTRAEPSLPVLQFAPSRVNRRLGT